MNVIVGVSDAKASTNPKDVLVTYSLGSCIGVALFEPVAGVAGLLHFQLPSASADPNRGRDRPLMFADTGMTWLIAEMAKLGADKRRTKVALAGGAQMLNDGGLFDIGRRNHASIRKVLWQHGMLIGAEDVGGNTPRTMFLNVSDGNLVIKSAQRAEAA